MRKSFITNRTTDFDEGFDTEPVDLAVDSREDYLRQDPQAEYIQDDNDNELDWMERYDNTGYVGWSRPARQT